MASIAITVLIFIGVPRVYRYRLGIILVLHLFSSSSILLVLYYYRIALPT